MEKKTHYSVTKRLESVLKIKRSLFICSLGPAASIKEAKAFISRISKAHHTATHNCWAYIIGENGDVFHSSDAGEPSGTAGAPILNTLQGFCLSNVAAVVTRHFGGVKLGIRGLIQAYSGSVKETIKNAPLKPLIPSTAVRIEVGYDLSDILLNHLNDTIIQVRATDYADKVTHTIDIETGNLEKALVLLSEYRSKGKLTFTVLS